MKVDTLGPELRRTTVEIAAEARELHARSRRLIGVAHERLHRLRLLCAAAGVIRARRRML
jgi:hypothetical protein